MNNYNPADRMVLNGDVVTIDMDDATAVLVVEETSTSGETQVTSNVLFVDPNSSGTSEILTLPAEADWAYPGLLYIFNTGGEAIDVQNDAGTSVDIVPSEKMGIFTCDGTTWYGGVTSEPAYIDVAAFATGTAGVKLADNVANAWEVLEDTNSYLKFVTATGAERIVASKALTFIDAIDAIFGTGEDAVLRFSTGDASNHALVLGIDDTSQQFHITDKAAVATDWARSAGTHPELAIHSNTTPATDYLAIGNHDGSTASINMVGGTSLTLDLDGTSVGVVYANGLQDHGVQTVTATTGGGTTGLIAAGAKNVTVASDSADKQISLPAATIGDVITITVGGSGCELISVTAADKVNNVTVGATNELALVATSIYRCEYVAANQWIVRGFTNLGADEAALVPDAL